MGADGPSVRAQRELYVEPAQPRTAAGRAAATHLAEAYPGYPELVDALTYDILAIEAEAAGNEGLRAAAQAWADLCHDYDLNERGQAIMKRLRAALAAQPAESGK